MDFKVKLQNSNGNSLDRVVFDATPDLIETRNVNYKSVDIIHAPGQIMAYQNTSSRTFNISQIRLISRTPDEAERNLRNLWKLRGWTMPRFGTSTLSFNERGQREATADDVSRMRASGAYSEEEIREHQEFFTDVSGTELRGAPPAVLLLSAYSKGANYGSKAQHISRVPVVLTNLSIPYPSDVDYIPTEVDNIPMPTILTIDLMLTETHAPMEYERFSLDSFKRGTLGGF